METEEENNIGEDIMSAQSEVADEPVWQTDYEKTISKEFSEDLAKLAQEWESKIVFDINITSIDIVLALLVDKEYDFATFEPSEEAVKITFRKDKVIKDTRYIKYPVYSNILLKAKALTKLTIEETEHEQEWTWEKVIRNKNYKITSKVVPSELWSKLFIKASEIEKKVVSKEIKKTSLSQIFTFLSAIAFIALIIWWAFIGFIVLNAKTIEDVKFFYSLWINLNDINNFIWQAIAIIFSILMFIETIFLVIFLFKFSLTKKEFKQKKIRYWILWAIILFLAFSTASAWMIIDGKIKSLPNWQEVAYWDVQLYDNSKLLSESFDKQWSLLQDTSNLIWPVQIKFDLSFYAKKEEQKWFTIKKYIWDFWNDNIEESPTPTIIHNFNEKWNYEVSLTIQEVDLQWKIIEKIVENIPSINISYVVAINEKKLTNWWKLVNFDASSLKELGKIEWYFMDNLNTPVWEKDIFQIGKPIFEETLVWMYIRRSDKTSEELDKLFIITWEDQVNLDWEITYTRWIVNDLEFEMKVENLQNDFWNWYIEEFKWVIWDKEITKEWDITNPTEASKITYTFKEYWEQKVTVILKDSAWETKTISTKIDIPKNLKLSQALKIFNNDEVLEDVKYEEKLNEYYINEIWVPTNLKFDARFLRSDNLLYTLKKVDWDYNSDWDIDESSKIWNYEVNTEWNHIVSVYYEFAHRKITNDIIKLKEQIFIEWLKKEAIINFDITKNSDYVPVVVSFDASKSQVKNDNIEKFIWDYGDGITEERDSIVPWHKYSTPWDYEIKLTVVTTSWKEFSTSKKLILKPKPQSVQISTSMKKAPVWQWIDFSSEKSEWQIIWYFWDFWDWNVSTEANPSHSYSKAWNYKTTLKLDFSNKNILEDSVNIEIYEE
jgi:PKD repeat protein